MLCECSLQEVQRIPTHQIYTSAQWQTMLISLLCKITSCKITQTMPLASDPVRYKRTITACHPRDTSDFDSQQKSTATAQLADLFKDEITNPTSRYADLLTDFRCLSQLHKDEPNHLLRIAEMPSIEKCINDADLLTRFCCFLLVAAAQGQTESFVGDCRYTFHWKMRQAWGGHCESSIYLPCWMTRRPVLLSLIYPVDNVILSLISPVQSLTKSVRSSISLLKSLSDTANLPLIWPLELSEESTVLYLFHWSCVTNLYEESKVVYYFHRSYVTNLSEES